tara:strand:+ start:210 stop:644 length:435 start_codon:yes stop_codon:yes gene_type:complete
MTEDPTPEHISIPADRTVKQPSQGFCRNPACVESGRRYTFEIENNHAACPKCGADRAPFVGLLVLTHLLIQDKDGPIDGDSGLRYLIACDTTRAYLATVTNKEAATDNESLYNCQGCAEAFLRHKNNRTLVSETTANQILTEGS